MKYQAVLFDFGAVLCSDYYYDKAILPEDRHVWDWLQENVFLGDEFNERWMRGKTTWRDVHRKASVATGFDVGKLDSALKESVEKMAICPELTQWAVDLQKDGTKIAVVTNNIDIFSEFVVPIHGFEKLFDVIINSADYGLMKNDENGKLLDIALEKLGCPIESALMIDDSQNTINLFESKGGHGHCYKDFAGLKSMLESC